MPVTNLLHSLIAGLRRASSILARRIAFPLLCLSAGLLLAQPCAAAPFEFEPTGSLTTAVFSHSANLADGWQGARCRRSRWQFQHASRGRKFTIRPSARGPLAATSPWDATGTARQCCLTVKCSSQEARRSPYLLDTSSSRARNSTTLQAAPYVYWEPRSRLVLLTRPRYFPMVRFWSRVASRGSRRRSPVVNSTIQQAEPGQRLVAFTTHALCTLQRCCRTARCWSPGVSIDTIDYLASAEVYDTASGTWTEVGSLANKRDYHTATLLPNGKVLVAGGADFDVYELSSAELYDPATGTWQATGSLATARFVHDGDIAAQRQSARRRR